MTCIAALRHEGHYHMAADSNSARANINLSGGTLGRIEKIWRNGAAIVGGSGMFRHLEVVRYCWREGPLSLDIPECFETPEHYIAAVVPRAIIELFTEYQVLQKDSEGYLALDTSFMIAFGGRLYVLDSSLCTQSPPDYDYFALGEGAAVAKGALHAMRQESHFINPGPPPDEQLWNALRIACIHSHSVSPPYYFLCEDDNCEAYKEFTRESAWRDANDEKEIAATADGVAKITRIRRPQRGMSTKAAEPRPL